MKEKLPSTANTIEKIKTKIKTTNDNDNEISTDTSAAGAAATVAAASAAVLIFDQCPFLSLLEWWQQQMQQQQIHQQKTARSIGVNFIFVVKKKISALTLGAGPLPPCAPCAVPFVPALDH